MSYKLKTSVVFDTNSLRSTEAGEDGVPFDEKINSLSLLSKEQIQKANELDDAIKENLKKIGYAI